MLQKYNTILWDFDGVILDSMKIRDLGFIRVLKDFPKDQVDQLLDYHRKNGGLSRYVKFRYLYETIRDEAVSEDRINELAAEFSRIMIDLLIDPHLLIKDSLAFIKENHDQVDFHVVSGSDGNELRKICDGLGLTSYFLSIQGSPTPKNDLVHELMKEYRYDQKLTCLIGDSINDYEAAKVNGISFYGYNNPDLKELPKGYIQSFSSL